MADTKYAFICKDPALDKKAAKAFLQATSGIEIVNESVADSSFLAKVEPSVAEAFKAANTLWTVRPEAKYKRPDTRLRIK